MCQLCHTKNINSEFSALFNFWIKFLFDLATNFNWLSSNGYIINILYPSVSISYFASVDQREKYKIHVNTN